MIIRWLAHGGQNFKHLIFCQAGYYTGKYYTAPAPTKEFFICPIVFLIGLFENWNPCHMFNPRPINLIITQKHYMVSLIVVGDAAYTGTDAANIMSYRCVSHLCEFQRRGAKNWLQCSCVSALHQSIPSLSMEGYLGDPAIPDRMLCKWRWSRVGSPRILLHMWRVMGRILACQKKAKFSSWNYSAKGSQVN